MEEEDPRSLTVVGTEWMVMAVGLQLRWEQSGRQFEIWGPDLEQLLLRLNLVTWLPEMPVGEA